LLHSAGRGLERASAYDLGFVAGPRINAAGRLTDMSLGIECLLSEDPARAADLARRLDELNRERRGIEANMQDAALAHLERIDPGEAYGLALYEADWHQGVVGILAARLRERFHRPVIAFAAGPDGELRGSGRSIPGLHLRDALDLLDKRQPGLLLRFGGHAAAAGLCIRQADFQAFRSAFDRTLRDLLSAEQLEQRLDTDGTLGAAEMTLELAQAIADIAWGQGFPPPRFHGVFRVADQRIVGGGHLKLLLGQPAGARAAAWEAMLFRHTDLLPEHIRAVYRLDVNEWNGLRALQLVLDYWEPVSSVETPLATRHAPPWRAALS
jgi:single-stranded-DNA-specific exonuclease